MKFIDDSSCVDLIFSGMKNDLIMKKTASAPNHRLNALEKLKAAAELFEMLEMPKQAEMTTDFMLKVAEDKWEDEDDGPDESSAKDDDNVTVSKKKLFKALKDMFGLDFEEADVNNVFEDPESGDLHAHGDD